MKRILICLAFFFLLFNTSAFSEDRNGNNLLRGCSLIIRLDEAQDSKLTSEERREVIYWVGYMGGFLDFNVLNDSLSGSKNKAHFCPPTGGISPTQVARILYKFLTDKPNQLHSSARILILIALTEAFPCK